MQMEALYIKLYEKYSKLKSSKDRELDEANKEQELKFVEFTSAADALKEYAEAEIAKLYDYIDELKNEIKSLRSAKDQQFDDFQQKLMEEKRKNRELSEKVEQLQSEQEKCHSGSRTDQHDKSVSSNRCSPSLSLGKLNESTMRITRKRARLSMENDSAINSLSPGRHEASAGKGKFNESPMRITRKHARLSMENGSAINSLSPGHHEASAGKGLHLDQPIRDASNSYVQPECCQSNIDSEGPCKCLFQNFVECLTGMKVSIANHPEGRSIHAIHQSSGYSYKLTWPNNASLGGELLYSVISLGTFYNMAPEWMRETIIFSVSMCPVFFERLSRIITPR